MRLSRIRELRTELNAGRISWGELAEIEEAFATIDPSTLSEPAENATAGDMLDELESRARAEAFTHTQTAALAELNAHGALWPAGRGRFKSDAGRYSHKTLQALVDAGLAHWRARPGVLLHIAPGAEEAPPAPAPVTDAQRIAYTLKRLKLWESNYRANAETERKRGMHQKALRLTIEGNTMADIIKMLDGTEDENIR